MHREHILGFISTEVYFRTCPTKNLLQNPFRTQCCYQCRAWGGGVKLWRRRTIPIKYVSHSIHQSASTATPTEIGCCWPYHCTPWCTRVAKISTINLCYVAPVVENHVSTQQCQLTIHHRHRMCCCLPKIGWAGSAEKSCTSWSRPIFGIIMTCFL